MVMESAIGEIPPQRQFVGEVVVCDELGTIVLAMSQSIEQTDSAQYEERVKTVLSLLVSELCERVMLRTFK
jgi:hypothetical protein